MFRIISRAALGLALLICIGCAPKLTAPPPPTPDTTESQAPVTTDPVRVPAEKPPQPAMPEPEPAQPSPQELASLELTQQGRLLIEENRPDAAIRVLERAVNIHPQNGQNYFFLAEAWLKKGNVPQAEEFHRLAVIYLREEAQWSSRLKIQELKIKNF